MELVIAIVAILAYALSRNHGISIRIEVGPKGPPCG
jgi:hypothetical protein